MDTLFFLLALLSLIAIPIGLIKPSLLKMPGRPQALALTAVATFVFLVLFIVTTPGVEKEEVAADVEEEEVEEEPVEEEIDEPVENEPEEPEPVEEVITEPVEEPEDSETLEQKNAVSMAEDYLNYTAFSKSGLVDQLKYEGFEDEDATYAVGQLNVDWQEQAVDMAFDYLDYSSFSRAGLIEQLEYEGFSKEDATYAADEVGL